MADDLAGFKQYLVRLIEQQRSTIQSNDVKSNYTNVIPRIQTAQTVAEITEVCNSIGLVIVLEHQELLRYEELKTLNYLEATWKFAELSIASGYEGIGLPEDIPHEIVDQIEQRFRECKYNTYVERVGHAFAVFRDRTYISKDTRLSDVTIAIYINMVNKHRNKGFKQTISTDISYRGIFERSGYHCAVVEDKLRITFD